MKIDQFIKKVQNLSTTKRKIILWSIVIVIGLVLLIFWFKNVQKTLKNFPKEGLKEKIQFPSFKEQLETMPKIEIPKIEEYEK